MIDKLKNCWRKIYHQLVEINDTPLRKALGLGLGVFLGIFPGVGPIAAVITSSLLRVNKAAALLGSVLTNTWLSIVTFVLAVKVGSILSGGSWNKVYHETQGLIENFHFKDLLNVSVFKIIQPVLVGYAVVSFAIGAIVGLLAMAILTSQNRRLNEKNF